MKDRYRLFLRRKSVYYAFDNTTKTFESLKTKDKAEATRLLMALNEAGKQPAMNLGLARVYLRHSDPMVGQRTWQYVMDEILKTKQDNTRHRWTTAVKDHAFDSIRPRMIPETNAEHFLQVLEEGTVSTNIYLRRIHNFALDMGWLPWPVVPKKQWPPVRFGEKRAITLEEHLKIIAREGNSERKAFYELAWHLGASQTDIALLEASSVDWSQRVISYTRKKTGESASVRFNGEVEQILRSRPSNGLLFPYLRRVREADRATEFRQRCRGLGIEGVTLHSYRYAWAERATIAGYPERFAQAGPGPQQQSRAPGLRPQSARRAALAGLLREEKPGGGDSSVPCSWNRSSGARGWRAALKPLWPSCSHDSANQMRCSRAEV